MKKILFICCAILVLSSKFVNAQTWGGLVSVPPTPYPTLTTFIGWEGNYNTQDIVGSQGLGITETVNVKFSSGNDEVRSGGFQNVIAGRVFEFYDNGNFSKNDDWCKIYFKQAIPSGYEYRIYTFEQSYEDAYVKVEYYDHGNLDGKISSFKAYFQ